MPSDYEKLTDRELNAIVSDVVMDIPSCKCEHRHRMVTMAFYNSHTGECYSCGLKTPRNYSNDDNAARLVRDRIIELGPDVAENFYKILASTQFGPMAHLYLKMIDGFVLMHSTPRQQCIAALQSLDTRERTSE